MPDVLIRNIDVMVLEKLKIMAQNNNRSLQEELKELLESHAKPDIEETRNRVNEILAKYQRTDKIFPDSSEELSKDRER